MTIELSPGDRLLALVPLKTAFYDRHDRRSYERMIEVAKRIVNDPSLVKNAVRFMETHMRHDAHQARSYALWKSVLALPTEQIARALLEDSDWGAELRGCAPVFTVLGPAGTQLDARLL